jgi:hypothetical protein
MYESEHSPNSGCVESDCPPIVANPGEKDGRIVWVSMARLVSVRQTIDEDFGDDVKV